MNSMRIQIAQISIGLLQQRRDAFLHDASLPVSVRGMISVHLEKPWIPNFWTIAIRPLKPDNTRYLDFLIGYAEDNTSWFFPSRQWWILHAHACHPPDGTGCDEDEHTRFLSGDNDAHVFDYGTILTDGTITVLGRPDFIEEGDWWLRAFGMQKEQP